MTAQQALAQWKKTHPSTQKAVQGEIFDRGTSGEQFALQSDCYRPAATMAEKIESEKRAHELDMAQGRLF